MGDGLVGEEEAVMVPSTHQPVNTEENVEESRSGLPEVRPKCEYSRVTSELICSNHCFNRIRSRASVAAVPVRRGYSLCECLLQARHHYRTVFVPVGKFYPL